MDSEKVTIREELNNVFTNEYIRNAGMLIHQFAEEFYKKNDLKGKVYFNDDIFQYCLIDILVDIARLKAFHDIDNVNYNKFAAYTASWCLKRKIFQLVEGCDKKYIYINEKFALYILLHASGIFDQNKKYSVQNEDIMIRNIKQLFYHLKYRNTNPQTLELLLVGMETGKMTIVTQ